MKNLKMFAISLLAFLVMASGVHAAGNYHGLSCTESDVDGKCSLTATGTLSNDNIDGDMTIVTSATKALKISNALVIEENVTLTIEGGHLQLTKGADITIGENAKLIVTGAVKDVTALDVLNVGSGAAPKIIVQKGGTLSVSNNADRGIVVQNAATPLSIKLTKATMEVSKNALNGMNGNVTIDATESTIEAKDNGLGGLNATFTLTDSDIVATGNGYQGVVLANGSSVDKDSTVTATGNLTGAANEEVDRRADKADVLIQNTLTVGGKIVTDSIAPEKDFWSRPVAGTIATGKVTFTNNGYIEAKESKQLCEGTQVGGACKNSEHEVIVDASSVGYFAVDEKATVYGAAKVTLSSNIKNVVVKNNGASVVVAAGTTVKNETGSDLYVTAGDTIYKIEKNKTNTLGEPVNNGDQTTPGDQTGNTGDNANTPDEGTTGRLPDQPAKTNDNILVYAGLGLVSALTVGFSAKRKENN